MIDIKKFLLVIIILALVGCNIEEHPNDYEFKTAKEIDDSFATTDYFLDGYNIVIQENDGFCDLWGYTTFDGYDQRYTLTNTCLLHHGVDYININGYVVDIVEYLTFVYEYDLKDEPTLEYIGVEIETVE